MPKNDPTTRKKAFAREYAKLGNATEAARRTKPDPGEYTDASARAKGCGLLKDPIVQEELSRILDKANVTRERIAQKIDKGMDATETKFFHHKGQVVETKEVVAWDIQRDFTELAAKMHRMIGPDAEQKNTEGSFVFIINYPDRSEKIISVDADYKKLPEPKNGQ